MQNLSNLLYRPEKIKQIVHAQKMNHNVWLSEMIAWLENVN